MYYSTTYPSPLGLITLACGGDGGALAGLWLAGQKYHGGAIAPAMTENGGLPIFDATKHWLDRYFAGQRPASTELPLAPMGSRFRQEVWAILREIPYGEVVTYGSIAKKMAAVTGKESMAAQAVGGAVGHNPISIIIPCHRVVGASGSLTGYAGGLASKIKLLELEGADMSSLFSPKKGTAL
jgi:methylated-DNA-[protein]-cysteine S-methyltransferase